MNRKTSHWGHSFSVRVPTTPPRAGCTLESGLRHRRYKPRPTPNRTRCDNVSPIAAKIPPLADVRLNRQSPFEKAAHHSSSMRKRVCSTTEPEIQLRPGFSNALPFPPDPSKNGTPEDDAGTVGRRLWQRRQQRERRLNVCADGRLAVRR